MIENLRNEFCVERYEKESIHRLRAEEGRFSWRMAG